MKGRRIPYNAEELAWIEANKTMPRRELHQTFVAMFERVDVSVDALKHLCHRKGWMTGRTGQYPSGSVPANKGKKMPYNANSARTQFKKGQVPSNRKHIGHERLSKDGYVEISVAETNPHTGHGRRYVQKHRRLWEELHGPVPDGMCLKCLDGNKQNTDPSNWEPIARGVLAQLNNKWSPKYDQAEPEIRPALLTTAKLRHRIKTIKDR